MPKENKYPPIKIPGRVDFSYNPYLYGLDTRSPSLNWCLGNTHILPFGHSLLLWGEAKSGKSLLCNEFAGKLFQDDPEAHVWKWNSEFRELLQCQGNMSNIDFDRYEVFEANNPGEVYDSIYNEIPIQIEGGRKIKLVIIDSVNAVNGLREMKAESVEDGFIGDAAVTTAKGLKKIIPVLRRYKVALIVTAQSRAELDPILSMRNKIKPALAYTSLHQIDWQIQIIQNKNKDGKMMDEKSKDMMDKALQTGHKIRCVVSGSSSSPSGRTSEFSLNYDHGIVNIGEEVAKLSTNLPGIVNMPNNRTYCFDGLEWKSWEAWVNALENDLDLRKKVVEAIKLTDQVIRL